MNETDAEKIIKFANLRQDDDKVENPILIVTNIPEGDDFRELKEYAAELAYSDIIPAPFNFGLINNSDFHAFPCIDKQGHFALSGFIGDYCNELNYEATEKAYKLARQARFEHRQPFQRK